MPEDGRDLILAGAILSIMLHPFIVSVIERERKEAGELSEAPAPASLAEEAPNPRTVLVGYGRVGSLVGAELKARGRRLTVIADIGDLSDDARNDVAAVIVGNAVRHRSRHNNGNNS